MRPPPLNRPRLVAAAVALVAAACLAAGCGTPSASSGGDGSTGRSALSEANQKLAHGTLAAVEIRGQSFVTVQETVESVFTGAGLTLARRSREQLVFERPATRREQGAYGTWFGSDARARLKVDLIPQTEGVYFLRCYSFIARDAALASEDEQSLARRHVRAYEHLLDEVANRLN